MRTLFVAFAGCWIAGMTPLHSQTFNWGSEVFSDLVDSGGNILDDTYVFELGAFVNNFVPDSSNTELWLGNWQVFDTADYNGLEPVNDDGIYGYFTSTAGMTPDGLSTSPTMTLGASSFENLDSYVWIRDSDLAEPGSEWLLVRADSWMFPAADPDCCGNDLPTEWSTSDLTLNDTPVWGSQAGILGGGEITDFGVFTLQTATFVPEPSSLLLSAFASVLLLRRRR